MSFGWNDYLALADELARGIPTDPLAECRSRSATSRAYYAAFNLALRWFTTNREYQSTRDGRDHEQLPRALLATREDTRMKIARALDRMRPNRVFADYRLPLPRDALPASTAIAQARHVVQLLATLDAEDG